jgi:proteasome lid subunit RPN8/RPN11
LRIQIRRSVINGILDYAKIYHPREGVLLLKGKVKEGTIMVEDIEIPPLNVQGESFSAFPLNMLPLDFSIVGTAHSHPSGVLMPSVSDLNNFYGRIMIIVAYPYKSEADLIVIDRKGERLNYELIEE